MSGTSATEMAALAAALASAMEKAANSCAPQMRSSLRGKLSMALQYEDAALQAKALSTMPTARLRREAAEAAELSLGLGEEPPTEETDAIALGLLHWFKADFFTWMDAPACRACGGVTRPVGMGQPSADELSGGASRVEVYTCRACGSGARFPRYNDPARLLQTRTGRCGEWANCFTLCCRALGLEARLVFDWTDHVWTEYYSSSKGRWIHLDPCEAAYDKPLLYESGWGKKLTYVVAFSRDGVADVSRRYAASWPDMLHRRAECPEGAVAVLAACLTGNLRKNMGSKERQALQARDEREQQELMRGHCGNEAEALPGRQTGSEQWRASRGETGNSSGGGSAAAAKQQPRCTRYALACDDQQEAGGISTSTARDPRRVVGGAVRASGDHPPHEVAKRAFDGRSNTKWLDFGGGGVGGTAWLEYRLLKASSPSVVAEYRLVSADDEPSRDPSAFVLEACPEGKDAQRLPDTEWLELDRRSGVAFKARGEAVSFQVSPDKQTPANAWRLRVLQTANPAAANSCQLACLELLLPAASKQPPCSSDSELAPRGDPAALEASSGRPQEEAAAGNNTTQPPPPENAGRASRPSIPAASSGISITPQSGPPAAASLTSDSPGNTSCKAAAAASTSTASADGDFQAKVKVEFQRIMARGGGVTPNEAAGEALKNVMAAMHGK